MSRWQAETTVFGPPFRACGTIEYRRRQCARPILIAEDNALLALDLSHALETAGFEVIGPALSVEQALALIESPGCDAAVLDINLGKETSELVALELKDRGTPFVTLSGYAPEQHPAAFHGAPALAKPLRPEVLVAEVRWCMEQEAHRPAI